jgi:beta-1,4-mannosyl-glycoprotein beta-1,4-N-acetylglucosaminyltransferase
MFYNEIDLLTYRLNLLNDVVDFFIIVESTHSHNGKEKNLTYLENKALFESFHKKIIHIVVEDFPHKYPNIDFSRREQWLNEGHQRNAISRGLNKIDTLSESDVIIIADLDEIPDPRTLLNIKKSNIKVDFNALVMDLYYYNLNTKIKGDWRHCKILDYKTYKSMNMTCNQIRRTGSKAILNGGWHLSYFGDKYFIQNKIQNFGHQEFNNSRFTDLSKIEERVANFRDLYDRRTVLEKIEIKNNNYLPIDYDIYLKKYYNQIE